MSFVFCISLKAWLPPVTGHFIPPGDGMIPQ
jgi:hypothetical protein